MPICIHHMHCYAFTALEQSNQRGTVLGFSQAQKGIIRVANENGTKMQCVDKDPEEGQTYNAKPIEGNGGIFRTAVTISIVLDDEINSKRNAFFCLPSTTLESGARRVRQNTTTSCQSQLLMECACRPHAREVQSRRRRTHTPQLIGLLRGTCGPILYQRTQLQIVNGYS